MPIGKRAPSMTTDMILGMMPVGGKRAGYNRNMDFMMGPSPARGLMPVSEFINLRPFYYRQYTSPRVSESRFSGLDSLADVPIGPNDMSA